MTEKSYFFESETPAKPEPAKDRAFFDALDVAGMIQESNDLVPVKAEASMKNLSNPVLALEYGTYQKDYAVHLTPHHPQRNLATDADVHQALREASVILNQYIPPTLQVAVSLPRADWKMKVISFVVKGGADAWNFDVPKFENEGIPKVFEAVQKVILK